MKQVQGKKKKDEFGVFIIEENYFRLRSRLFVIQAVSLIVLGIIGLLNPLFPSWLIVLVIGVGLLIIFMDDVDDKPADGAILFREDEADEVSYKIDLLLEEILKEKTKA